MTGTYSLTGYRQSTSTINKIKKLRFKAQQSRKFRCKDDKEKYLEKVGKPHRKLMDFVAKNIKKITNDIKIMKSSVAEEKEALAQKANSSIKIKEEKRINEQPRSKLRGIKRIILQYDAASCGEFIPSQIAYGNGSKMANSVVKGAIDY
jgi:hypothetical protein